MNFRNFALGVLAAALMASCSSKRNALPYFQDIEAETFSVDVNSHAPQPKIEPTDELNISITSKQPSLSVIYNLPMSNPAISENGFISVSSPQQATYYVSAEGDIVMPILGKIHVAGMTTAQLEELLTKKLENEIEDPTVVVRIMNFTVNVAGEVLTPGKYHVNGERFSILDALSTAGDLTPYGDRTKIVLIREENGKRVAHELDLTSAELLSSPYFYLKQNDYVYVTPNKIREANSRYNQDNAFKLSVVSTIVSGVSVIASLVIALAIK